MDIKRREDSINRSKRDLDAKLSKLESVYNTDATRRMRHVNELSAEHLKNEEILDRMAMTALFHNVQQKEEDITKKIIRREKKLHRQDTEEMDRLHEILAADESNRSAARKRDRRKAHLMQQINAIRDASIGSN